MEAVLRSAADVRPSSLETLSVIDRLAFFVEQFCALEEEAAVTAPPELYHQALTYVHSICGAVLECERAGYPREQLLEVLAPAREIHSRSAFGRRLQQWPRGYPGDFETIEYICSAENRAPVGTLEYACEGYALNLPIAQQHRNKVQHQAIRILKTMLEKPRASRIFEIACGSSPDLAILRPHLPSLAGELWLNDADADALAHSAGVLESIAGRCHFVRGNFLRVARKMEKLEPFDLVLAGGLFDYLPEKHAAYLIEHVHHNLLAPGGTFFFTNIARGNPWRCLIEYMTDWFLLERSEQDLRRLCAGAGVQDEEITIRRDATNLALLVEVTKKH